MYIEYTFKVNAFSVEKGVISVTYIPVDPSLELNPVNVQQLGVDRQIMIDYATAAITQAEFQALMRKAIVDADVLPQETWNKTLEARQLIVPAEVDAMIGYEWPVVTENESVGLENPEVIL